MSREVEFRGVVKRLYLKDKYGNWIYGIYGEYVNEDYCCDDWNDDEKAYWISESKGC